MDWWGAVGGRRGGPPCPRPAPDRSPGGRWPLAGCDGHQPSRDETRQARGADPAPAGPMAAAACPPGQVGPHGPRPPGQARQAALVAAMHGSRGHGPAWAGGGGGGHSALEPHRRLLQGNSRETAPTSGGEARTAQGLTGHGHDPL
jgi:hypothetical protein